MFRTRKVPPLDINTDGAVVFLNADGIKQAQPEARQLYLKLIAESPFNITYGAAELEALKDAMNRLNAALNVEPSLDTSAVINETERTIKQLRVRGNTKFKLFARRHAKSKPKSFNDLSQELSEVEHKLSVFTEFSMEAEVDNLVYATAVLELVRLIAGWDADRIVDHESEAYVRYTSFLNALDAAILHYKQYVSITSLSEQEIRRAEALYEVLKRSIEAHRILAVMC